MSSSRMSNSMVSSLVDHCPSQVPVSVKVSSTPRQAVIAWGWNHFLAAWLSTQKLTYAGMPDPEESLRGRASIGVSREDGGDGREVATVDCLVTREVQSVGRVRAQGVPHIQDDFTESVGETVFGVGEVKILDISGVKGDQGIHHRGVLLVHALPVGVGIGAQGHHVWGRDQAEVVLARPLERVCLAVEFPANDCPDRLGVHAVGRHNEY